MSYEDEFASRLSLFHESFTEEEVDTFARSMVTSGEMIELGFGAAKASASMAALSTAVLGLDSRSVDDWREFWGGISLSGEGVTSPAMEQAHDLHSFAYFGIIATSDLPEVPKELEISRTDVPAYIGQTIARFEKFMSLFGSGAPTYAFAKLQSTILAARGRLKIDQDLPMSVHELAALSQVALKRLQNAIYARNAQSPVLDANGLITPASARQWLADRDFLPSIWQQRYDDSQAIDEASIEDSPADVTDDFLFVPEAADGSLFAPNASAKGTGKDRWYRIGAKGALRRVDDYEEALADLARMVTPRWHRANSAGNGGVVTAVRWRRFRKADLERL